MFILDQSGMHSRARRGAFSLLILAGAGVLLVTPHAVTAQRQTPRSASASATERTTSRALDVRWYPWIGCWQRTTDAGPNGVLTCVVPAEGASVVDLVTVANGAVESREHLVVDARPHEIAKDGCTGSQTATWATTGARVYIGSAYTCAGNIHGRSSTLYAILPTGEWIDARQVESGDGRVLNVTRYRDAGLPSTVPASIRSQITAHTLAATTARASAGGSVSQNEVAEAQRAVDSVVVRAWLTARAQGYAEYTPAQAQPGVTVVRVYEGTPPSSQAEMPNFPSTRVPTCDSSGCYSQSPYSDYNGLSYSQYPMYPYSPYANPYAFGYYPYAYPVVVFGTGSRVGHGFNQGRPPVFHTPFGRPPAGPSGFHPMQPRPRGRP